MKNLHKIINIPTILNRDDVKRAIVAWHLRAYVSGNKTRCLKIIDNVIYYTGDGPQVNWRPLSNIVPHENNAWLRYADQYGYRAEEFSMDMVIIE